MATIFVCVCVCVCVCYVFRLSTVVFMDDSNVVAKETHNLNNILKKIKTETNQDLFEHNARKRKKQNESYVREYCNTTGAITNIPDT